MNRPFLQSIMWLTVVFSPDLAAASPASLSFDGTEKMLPRGARLSVTTLDLQTGVVVDNFETKPRPRVTAQCDARFCVTAVQSTSIVKTGKRRTLQQYLGISKGFGGEVRTASHRIVRIAKRSNRARANSVAERAQRVPNSTGQIRIGVPGSGFTINKELANLIGSPKNLASPVITTLVQSPCYRGDGSYSVVEVDPRILAERKKEFDLIKKGYVKSDPNFRDNYARPDHSVSGSVSQTGNAATATVQITNSAGQVVAATSATTSNGGWFEALNRATLDLASQLCQGPKVNIALAQCFLRECSCGSNSLGYRIDLRVEGVAKLPLGGVLYASVPAEGSITQNCGGTTPSNFGGALACRRLAEPQPESFEYTLASIDPVAPSCTCPREGAPQALSFFATALDLTSGERDDAIAEDIPCVSAP